MIKVCTDIRLKNHRQIQDPCEKFVSSLSVPEDKKPARKRVGSSWEKKGRLARGLLGKAGQSLGWWGWQKLAPQLC